MIVNQLKINAVTNPVGFSFPRVKCSWKVESATDKKQSRAKITVATDSAFSSIILEKDGAELSSIGETIDISLSPYTRYYYKVEVWGDNGDYGCSDAAYFETGKMASPWIGEYISTQDDDKAHPVFVKSFKCPDNTVRARIYITGLGLYEAYLNGIKIGNDYLAPFCNDYNVKIQYQTYDITSLLDENNDISIMCGNGWYKGRLGYEGDVEFFGDRFGTIAEIHLWDKDGGETVISTDSTWKYHDSYIIQSDIYDGEVIDMTNPSVSDLKNVTTPEFDKTKLVERYSLPVFSKGTISVQDIITTPAGETVLDFGQNFAGYVSFICSFNKGCRITFDFGEILQGGNFYNDNYRTAKAQFTYTSDGVSREVRPHFTYYGFRYVRVSGWEGAIDKNAFTGHVLYSDLDTTVKFESSNNKLNRLYKNCMFGQKSNFIDMPTDCPQRDERLGWTGDAQVFSPTASFNMDTRAFYRKFLNDLHIEQIKNGGAIPNYIPNNSPMPGGSSVWGDAASFIPVTLYNYYGDIDELRDYYPMMKDWVDFIIRGDHEHGDNHLWNFGFHFGDWLAQDGATPQSMKGGTDDFYVASMYYYASVKKLSDSACLLDLDEDSQYYKDLSNKIFAAILKEYFSPNGRLCIDTQTGYLLSLKFGVYIDKERVLAGFRERLKKDCYKIKGGFVGATMMCQVMAENGLEDLAYYILFQEGFPGWMHCINLGATTIWERWNSVLDDGTISGTEMNSLNHYSYGSVMEYVYRSICGINESAPGFRSVKIAPSLNSRLKSAHLEYDSVSGKYVSDWKINSDGTLSVHFEVPFNCSAEVILPGTDGEVINLDAGIFEKTYTSNVDYTKRYNMNSRLIEMKDDPEALKILSEDLPIAAGIIAGGNEESMNMTFNELQFMFFFGFNPQMIAEGTTRLFTLLA